VKLLLSHKCDFKLCAQDDTNALHFASMKGHTECIRQLLTAGEALVFFSFVR
jgi:ankyrin repeat protein